MDIITKKLRSFIAWVKQHPYAFLFTVAVVVRVILFLMLSIPDQSGGDLPFYTRLAESILEDGGVDYGKPVAPGWAIWLAGVLSVSAASQAIFFSQLILSGLLAVGTFKLGTYMFSRQVGLWSGLAVAIWPTLILTTFSYGQSITLYAVLLVFGVYYLYRAIRENDHVLGLLAGLLFVSAAFTDVMGVLVPFVVAVGLIGATLVKSGLKSVQAKLLKAWRPAVVGLLVFVTALSLWGYRNHIVTPEGQSTPVITKRATTEFVIDSQRRQQTIEELAADKFEIMRETTRRMFALPFNLFLLNQGSDVSYKRILRKKIALSKTADLSARQWLVLSAKIIFTVLHWLLLLAVVWAVVRKPKHPLIWITGALLLYVYLAVAVYAALRNGAFRQALSPAPSFLVPLIPLFLILATAQLSDLDRVTGPKV